MMIHLSGLAHKAMEVPRFEIPLRKDIEVTKGWPLEAGPLNEEEEGVSHE